MSDIYESVYKGNPILVIKSNAEDKFPFQFGVKKAKLVLLHLDAVKAFIQKHSSEVRPGGRVSAGM